MVAVAVIRINMLNEIVLLADKTLDLFAVQVPIKGNMLILVMDSILFCESALFFKQTLLLRNI